MPAVREANRIVQTLLIPAIRDRAQEKAVRAVIHSGYLEGFPDDMPWQSQLWMYARGEVTRDNSAPTPTKADRSPANPNTPPSVRRTFPRAGGRPRKRASAGTSQNTTLTEEEVAAALQISIDEVGELFEANRLTSFDLDGEERIPDWQLVKPATPEFGDPSVAPARPRRPLRGSTPQPLSTRPR